MLSSGQAQGWRSQLTAARSWSGCLRIGSGSRARESPPAGRRPALARDLDRGNTRGDHRRRRHAPARLGCAMLIVVVDTAAFAFPLAPLLLAYFLLARPVWFRGRWRALSPRRVAGVAIRVHREIRAAAPGGRRATLTVERTGYTACDPGERDVVGVIGCGTGTPVRSSDSLRTVRGKRFTTRTRHRAEPADRSLGPRSGLSRSSALRRRKIALGHERTPELEERSTGRCRKAAGHVCESPTHRSLISSFHHALSSVRAE